MPFTSVLWEAETGRLHQHQLAGHSSNHRFRERERLCLKEIEWRMIEWTSDIPSGFRSSVSTHTTHIYPPPTYTTLYSHIHMEFFHSCGCSWVGAGTGTYRRVLSMPLSKTWQELSPLCKQRMFHSLFHAADTCLGHTCSFTTHPSAGQRITCRSQFFSFV